MSARAAVTVRRDCIVKVYVAGPMTGLPCHNLPAFAAAAAQLDQAGYVAVNPGRGGVVEGYRWEDYVRRGLVNLVGSDAVALLDGWQDSRGAQLEVHVAQALAMPVRTLAEWLEDHT